MVRVCAWCRLFLGLKRPLAKWEMTHGVCQTCVDQLTAGRDGGVSAVSRTVLVVSRDPIGLKAAGKVIGGAGYPMALVADRRLSERRARNIPVALDRRRGGDRRASPPATWTHGYVLIESSVEPEIAALATL